MSIATRMEIAGRPVFSAPFRSRCSPQVNGIAGINLPSGTCDSPIGVSTDANELFNAIIVGRQLGVANGPVVTKTIMTGRFEIEVSQPPAKPAPVQRLAPDYARAHPHKGLARVCGIGMLRVLDVEVAAEMGGRILHPLFSLLPTRRTKAAIHYLIRPGVMCKVSGGIYRRPGFQDQHFEATRS